MLTGLPAVDPYLDAQTTEATFDALVKNERRIETCFEGMRFYDLRRWTTDANWESVINGTGSWRLYNPGNSYSCNLYLQFYIKWQRHIRSHHLITRYHIVRC